MNFQYQHLICLVFSPYLAKTMLSFLSLKEYWDLQPSLISNVSICGFEWLPTIHILQSEFPLTVDTGMACSIMEIFLLFCILRELLEPALLPWHLRLCLFKKNVSWTVLEVSSHLNFIVKPREMLPLMVSVRESKEIVWIEIVRGVTGLSSSIAGIEGCSHSHFLGPEHFSALHHHVLQRLLSSLNRYQCSERRERKKCRTAFPTSTN